MLDFSFASLKIPWLREVATMAPCSQLVAKTKKTPFYGPLTSGFAVHCVYSGLPISHGNRPNVPKPTRKNNFRRVQLPSAPPYKADSFDTRVSETISLILLPKTLAGLGFTVFSAFEKFHCAVGRTVLGAVSCLKGNHNETIPLK